MSPMDSEPRTMTLLDILALVAGFAVAFTLMARPEVSLRPRSVLDGYGPAGPPFWMTLLVELTALGMPLGFSLSAVVLARRLRDGRPLRAVGWLTILVGLAPVILAFPRSELHEGLADLLIGFGGVVSGFIGIVAWRRRLPGPIQTVLLVMLLWLLAWWPVSAAAREVPSLAWRFYSVPIVASSWPFRLHHASLRAAGLLPLGLLAGVPVAATIRGGWRGWSWADWAGAATAFALVPSAVVLVVLAPYLYVWKLEPQILAAWFMIVAALSGAVVAGLSPTWGRWFRADLREAPGPPAESVDDAR
jgi:hypothetical protein